MAERGRPRAFDREAALRHAMGVFWRRGFEGSSMAELTDAMGISSPSLYAAFGCKDALFREAVDLYCRTDGAMTADALRAGATAHEAIAGMLKAGVDNITGPETPSGCLVVLAATMVTPANDSVREYLSAMRVATVEELRRRILRGQAEGDVPATADAAKMAAFYATVLHGLSIQASDGASRETLHGVADLAIGAWDGLTRPT